VGVDPCHRGKGYGRQLLQPVLDHCDRNGLGAYLENSKEQNLTFYRLQGFEVTKELVPGPDAPTLWLMWRDPQDGQTG
jgi:GNAT superfamily N-acetyltransferase